MVRTSKRKSTHSKEKPSEQQKENNGSGGEEEEYEVECILGHRIRKGSLVFKVKWKGYDDDECTWEPESNLYCTEILDEYKTNQMDNKKVKKKTTNLRRKRSLSSEHSYGDSDSDSDASPNKIKLMKIENKVATRKRKRSEIDEISRKMVCKSTSTGYNQVDDWTGQESDSDPSRSLGIQLSHDKTEKTPNSNVPVVSKQSSQSNRTSVLGATAVSSAGKSTETVVSDLHDEGSLSDGDKQYEAKKQEVGEKDLNSPNLSIYDT